MRFNLNHPSFINFIDNVNISVINNVNFNNYFDCSIENKTSIQHIVFKLIKSSVKLRAKISDEELKNFITILWKRNEDLENFEFTQILLDITKNFDSINETIKPQKRQSKVIKTDKKINEE
jgi:hypothetical protein